jgi:cysteine desulfurase
MKQSLKPIYLDYNATTPIDPQVFESMLPFLQSNFGNPSSSHVYGRIPKEALEKSRQQVAALIGAEIDEIIFTSGGTESNNHAIIGAALANKEKGNHIITSIIEHPAVMETCRYLERLGFRITYLPVDEYGLVHPEDVQAAIIDDTILITIMHANNEVGTIQPIDEVGDIAKKKEIPFHTDAAQSCGKVEVDVEKLQADLLTIAGHKIYAPKGVGALYIRKGTVIDNFVHGAGQEMGMRAGTENVPYMVGLGVACDIAKEVLPEFSQSVRMFRDSLYENLLEGIGCERVKLNGHPDKRLPNTLNVSILGTVGEMLLNSIPELAASTAAACHSGSFEPSKVLLASGLSKEEALGALRLSLGRGTTREEVDTASRLIVEHANEILKVQSRQGY